MINASVVFAQVFVYNGKSGTINNIPDKKLPANSLYKSSFPRSHGPVECKNPTGRKFFQKLTGNFLKLSQPAKIRFWLNSAYFAFRYTIGTIISSIDNPPC